MNVTTPLQVAVFANGCFWCTEAVFTMLKGVHSVVSGYTGGTVENPTYEQVCETNTGHAEAIKIEYDSSIITFDDLLAVFFNTHDPTTRNRQGNDVGTQYRSVIFFADEEQKQKAESLIAELNATNAYEKPVVTEVAQLGTFYPAETYHQGYYRNHSDQAYCQIVIAPKLDTLQKKFAQLLKDSNQ
ncbi:MAG: peptide-methionine (S)-S-oxide reductase MsrA [bacterium]|nr:peptide-methionine (S)-S-oxide reductase MsrA [bacterium]